MMFNERNVQILTVNYNTPDLILEQYKSIKKFLSNDIIINLVDGTDSKLSKRGDEIINLHKKMIKIFENDNNTNHYLLGYNIHHGPGMDYGINKIESPYILILDSDVSLDNKEILKIFNDNYKENFISMGGVCYVDKKGFNVKNNYPNKIKYIHPSIMLLNKQAYLKSKYKFEKHGAPCISFMKNANPENLIGVQEIKKKFNYKTRGTIKFFGIGLK